MSDIGAQQAPASKGIQYPKQEESDPMSGIIKMLKGKPKPTMQAGPDSGLHMDKA
jgi:hypothetical protein